MNVSMRKNLEITQNLLEKNTLFLILNKTVTSIDRRMLHRWLNSLSKNFNLVKNHYESIKILRFFYKELRPILQQVNDLERIFSRLALRTALHHDFIHMCSTLKILPRLHLILKKIKLKHIKA